MPALDPKQVALVEINEAIMALDLDPNPLPGVHHTVGLLLEARETLTDKPWPNAKLKRPSGAEHERWLLERMAEQMLDGRL